MKREDFVTYDQARHLKDLGFVEECFAKFIKNTFQMNALGGGNNYNTGAFGTKLISAPTYSQAFDWFREEHGFDTLIVPEKIELINRKLYRTEIQFWINEDKKYGIEKSTFNSYREAQVDLLDQLIEQLK